MKQQELTNEHWRQVKEIFQAAGELPAAERKAYLTEVCAGNPSLLTEVESLLAAHEEPGSFMDTPAFNLAEDPAGAALLGKSLGHYRILSLLGRGGMGEVYRAKDATLGRDVAIKALPSDFSFDRDQLRRFEQEARAASALNHPNIITIHEFGQEDGVRFIVSEFIEGETLRRRISSERISAAEIPEIAIQITSALNAAHEAGIVHRDIKPENVMVRPDGLVKVLDFGLAKLIERRSFDTVTDANELAEATTAAWGGGETGVVMGTVNYMSPEQARGQRLDARSDLFSLGVALYEMAAGCAPFARATAADTIASILEKEPPPLAQFTSEVPEAMEQIIRKALSKDRKERYQTARELLDDLKSLKSGNTPVVSSPAKKAPRTGAVKRRLLGAAFALAALVTVIAGAVYYSRGDRTIESIAVLPFVNVDENPDAEYLADGITETLIYSLSRLSDLKVRPRDSVFRYKGRGLNSQTAGRELKVEAVLAGQIRTRGDQIVISLDLIDVRDNRQIWGARYQRRLADLLTVQADIAREVSQNLRLRLSGDERRRLVERYTYNIEANETYLRGRFLWNKRTKEDFEKAIEYFNRAIAMDPGFALAYSGLADCYLTMTTYGMFPTTEEGFSKTKEAAKQALAMDDTLAEAHTTLAHLAWLHEWNWDAGERGFKRAIDLNPNYPTAHQWYASYLSAMARHEEAIAEIMRAQELDPVSMTIGLDVARTFYFARQYDRAIEQSLRALEMDPSFYRIGDCIEMAYEQKGFYDKALEAQLKAMAARGSRPETISALKAAFAASGWKGYLRKQLELMKAEAGKKSLPTYSIARLYARLGDNNQALDWLQKAYDKHSDYLVLLKVDPMFDETRSDPRFAELMRKIGLAP
ncbi:MAG TPA: protein kinase [Blastocatellia bacterium]|jgi:serine/threonine protein kinase/tetratricopeptide (TPR) repeat protein